MRADEYLVIEIQNLKEELALVNKANEQLKEELKPKPCEMVDEVVIEKEPIVLTEMHNDLFRYNVKSIYNEVEKLCIENYDKIMTDDDFCLTFKVDNSSYSQQNLLSINQLTYNHIFTIGKFKKAVNVSLGYNRNGLDLYSYNLMDNDMHRTYDDALKNGLIELRKDVDRKYQEHLKKASDTDAANK